MFWIVQSWGTLIKLGAQRYWLVLEYNLEDDKLKHPDKMEKLGVLVKSYISYWDNMVFLWGFCLLPEKMALFFSILNKWLPIVAQYLEVFCRIIEYPAMSTSPELIYCRRTAEFLRERVPSALISGKIIWEKKHDSSWISHELHEIQLYVMK